MPASLRTLLSASVTGAETAPVVHYFRTQWRLPLLVLIVGFVCICLDAWLTERAIEAHDLAMNGAQAQSLAAELDYRLHAVQGALSVLAQKQDEQYWRAQVQNMQTSAGERLFERLEYLPERAGAHTATQMITDGPPGAAHLPDVFLWLSHPVGESARLRAGLDLGRWLKNHPQFMQSGMHIRVDVIEADGTHRTVLDDGASGEFSQLLLSRIVPPGPDRQGWELDIWQGHMHSHLSVLGFSKILQVLVLFAVVIFLCRLEWRRLLMTQGVEAVSQDALHKHERWTRALDATHDGVWEYDLVRKALFIAPMCFDLTGFSAEARAPFRLFLRNLGQEQRRRLLSAVRAARMESSRLDELVSFLKAGEGKHWLRIRGSMAKGGQYFTGAISDVTEEIELARERDRYQSFMAGVIDALPMPISVKNAAGQLILVNKLHAQSLHKMIGDLVGKRANQLVDSKMAEQLEMIDRLVLDTGLTHSLEDWFDISLVGKRVFLRITKSRCLDENGKAVIVTTYEDQTEVRSYARRLADLNVKVQSFVQRLIETIPHPLYVKDAENRYLIVNAALADQWGMRAEDMVGCTSRELFGEERGALMEEEDRRVMTGEVVRRQDSVFHARTAQLRHWAVTKRSCLDIDGKPVIVGSNYELTDIRQAELDLRAALDQQTRMRAFLQETFDALPHPLFIKDRKHRYIMTNRAHAAFHNCPRERIIGSTSWEYAVPEIAQSIQDEEERLFKGESGNVCESEYSLVDGMGRIRRNLIRKVLSRDAEGNPILIGITIDITELHEAEARQARLREFYQRLFDAIPLPVVVKDTQHIYQLVNKAFCDAYKRPLAEILGKGTWDVANAEEARQIVERDDALFEHPGEIDERDVIFHYADGVSHEVVLRNVVYEGLDGERLMVSTHTDVSDLRQMERNLRGALARLTALIENAPLGIALLSHPCTICNANPALQKMLGYSVEELAGNNYRPFVAPMYRALDEQKKAEIDSAGILRPFEMALLTKDRGEIPVVVSAVMVREDPEHPLFWVLVADLTERNRALEALSQSEARWQFALEGTGDGVWDWHIPTDRIYYSTRCKAMLGYDEQAAAPDFEGWLQTLHPEDREDVRQKLQAHLEGRTPMFISEHRQIRKDGRYMWVLNRGKVLEFDEHGKPLRVIGTHSDIEQRKQEEVALLRHRDELQDLVDEQTAGLVAAKEAAERANVAKTEFLSNVSHELRTPMHAILSFAQMGEERAGRLGPEKLKEYFHRVASSGERLLKLLDELLDISKLEAGRMVMDLHPSRMPSILEDVATEFEALLSARKITLHIDCAENLPNVSVDAKRIGQVVRNLLSNAIKFTPDGGAITMQLRVSAGEEAEKVFLELHVLDTGPGIPDGELENIFDRFVQSSRNRSSQGGTGLGLAICREIVRAHGGRLYALNRAGGGAEFVVSLPQAHEVVA